MHTEQRTLRGPVARAALPFALGMWLLAGCAGGTGASADGARDDAGDADMEPDTVADASDATDGDAPTAITFYYPVQVGSPLEETVGGLVDGFVAENPDIEVELVYTGNYTQTLAASQAAIDGGDAPTMTVQSSRQILPFIKEDLISPISDYVDPATVEGWQEAFYPAYYDEGLHDDELWSVPYQRSNIVQFWNKDAFAQAGLDPDAGPQNWDELVALGKQVQDGSDVTYGVQINWGRWSFEALAIQNGLVLGSEDGTEVRFDDPATVEALEFWVDLAQEHGVHQAGTLDDATATADFINGGVGIHWDTTGNLKNILENADFEVGASMLPAKERRGTPTGGANIFIFKDASEAEREAAGRLIEYLLAPEQVAVFSIASGYVAPRADAWDLPEMKAYVEGVPQALVARDQLEYAERTLIVHEAELVGAALTEAIERAQIGDATPAEALSDAQQRADSYLAPYQD